MKKTAILVLLAACGGGDEGAKCSTASGVYRLEAVRQTGECADLQPKLVSYGPGDTTPAPAGTMTNDGCTIHLQTVSADQCEFSDSRTCPIANPAGWTATTVQTVRFTSDRAVATGTISAQVRDASGKLSCGSIYGLSLVRQ